MHSEWKVDLFRNGKSLGRTGLFYSTCSKPGCHGVGKDSGTWCIGWISARQMAEAVTHHYQALTTHDTHKRILSEPQSLTTKLEVIISLVSAVARKFMQDRHAG